MGIGRELQSLTRKQLGPHCTVTLLAAPKANEYYPSLGYEHHPRCWSMKMKDAPEDAAWNISPPTR